MMVVVQDMVAGRHDTVVVVGSTLGNSGDGVVDITVMGCWFCREGWLVNRDKEVG